MKILVVDDHPLFQDALELSLRREWQDADIVFISALNDPRLESPSIAETPFDLIVLDWHMPGNSEKDPLSWIRERGVRGPVAVVTGMAVPAIAREALRLGAAAFLSKTVSRRVMVLALRLVAEGASFVPADIALALAGSDEESLARGDEEEEEGEEGEEAKLAPLTDREREVLGMLSTGATNKEIARQLNLAEVTVKLHARRILRKLGARNRTDAVRKAQDAGLLGPAPLASDPG